MIRKVTKRVDLGSQVVSTPPPKIKQMGTHANEYSLFFFASFEIEPGQQMMEGTSKTRQRMVSPLLLLR